jgi:hypothetical protein
MHRSYVSPRNPLLILPFDATRVLYLSFALTPPFFRPLHANAPSAPENFALTETSYITVRLLQEFSRIECRDPEPWYELLTMTCRSLGGCRVGLYPREH